MKHFKYQAPTSYDEAGKILSGAEEGKAAVMAGGTDLLGVLKTELLPEYPETVVALRDIPETEYITKENGSVKIGAMTKLCDIEKSEALQGGMEAVSQAAYSVASPLIRNRATIGGNLCQDVRCWFYRFPDQVGGTLECMRKGGETCYAIHGDNRYHSVFGGMKVGATPCRHNCPAGTDIPTYMEQIRKGDWDGAARTFFKYNPMPMMTSRICPHVCKDGCNQKQYGDSVNIPAVERSLGDYIMKHKDIYYAAPTNTTGKKCAVIGAGPGGLAAAFYLRKAGHEVTVYDAHEKAGGVLRYGIPHYRLPKSMVDEYCDALKDIMGIKFVMNTKVGQDIMVEDIKAQNDAVYFGTGAWSQPVLGLDGEKLTTFGLNFLVEVNTYLQAAIGENVLVCGGGNVAMDVALTARRLGAKSVKLVCLEQREEMPASPEEVAMALEEGVEIFNGWGLGKVITDEGGKVTGLQAKRCLSVRDENGRFAPKYDENDTTVYHSDFIVLATGQKVDIDFLGEKLLGQLKTTRGLIDADIESGKTKEEGYYAGGDAVTGPDLAIRAIRAGRSAAATMNKDLGVAAPAEEESTGFIKFDVEGVKVTKENKLPETPVAQRTLTGEDFKSYDDETVKAEANRCMNCGCYSVNASDLSPVMVALDAQIKTSKGRTVPAADFFCTNLKAYANLDSGELLTEIELPVKEGYVSGYEKFRMRPSIDFAMASLAWSYKLTDGKIEDVRLVLGAVAPVPVRLTAVEELLKGKAPSAELAAQAGELATAGTESMGHNEYKIDEIRAFVSRLVESMK